MSFWMWHRKPASTSALKSASISTEVIVQGENVAQVETQSSELAGTVTGKEITQLELNGRNFTHARIAGPRREQPDRDG